MIKNKIAKHICDIYIISLKENITLRKVIYNGIVNRNNINRMRAATFISYYCISEKVKDYDAK